MTSKHYIVEFENDNSVDIVKEEQIVTDTDIIVGDQVQVMYRNKRKISEYEATVIYASEKKEDAEVYLSTFLCEENENQSGEESLGRGKRFKKKKTFDSDEEDEEIPKQPGSNKEAIKKQESKSAKEVLEKLINGDEAIEKKCNCTFSKNLMTENRELKKKVETLTKEKNSAIDVNKWLNKIKKLAQTFTPPGPGQELNSQPSDLQPIFEKGSNIEEKGSSITTPPPELGLKTEEIEIERTIENHEDRSFMEDDKFFLHPTMNEEVEELIAGSGVFIGKQAMMAINMQPKSHCKIARNLLVAVFRPEVLKTCSLFGQKTNVGGNKRNALPIKGVQAVFDAAKTLATKHNLQIMNNQEITKNLGTKLCEIRKQK